MHRVLKSVLALAALTAVGACASAGATNGARPTATSHCYTTEEVSRIEAMREDGRSLAEVAAAVGGTRDDVRVVEKRLRDSRRGAGDPPPATCERVVRAP